MVSAVTPGAVAPPLSPPFHGATHGGAYPLGTATLPVVVSQFGPQSTCSFSAFAWSKVIGAPSDGLLAADARVALDAVAAMHASAHTTTTTVVTRALVRIVLIEPDARCRPAVGTTPHPRAAWCRRAPRAARGGRRRVHPSRSP